MISQVIQQLCEAFSSWHIRMQLGQMPAIISFSIGTNPFHKIPPKSVAPSCFQGIEIIPGLHTPVSIIKMFIKS